MTDSDPGPCASRPKTAHLTVARNDGSRPGEDEALSILVRHEPEYVLVTVAGEIDFSTVAGLRERLFALARTGRPLVADLDRVRFIDATGLGALAGAARQAAAHGASLHVVCARPQIRRPFRLTGLDRTIPLAGSLTEALQALAAGTKAEAV